MGIRLVNYLDDYAFLVKRKDAKLVAAYIQAEFEVHGLELNVEKSEFEPQKKAVVLGVGIDLDKQILVIPDKKKKKLLEAFVSFWLQTVAVEGWASRRLDSWQKQ